MGVYIGCDIGTVSIKAAVLVDDAYQSPCCSTKGGLRELRIASEPAASMDGLRFYLSPYRRIHGCPFEAAVSLIDDIVAQLPDNCIHGIVLTGAGAAQVTEIAGFPSYSEFKALATGVVSLHPDVETIFEMGGENSKFLKVRASSNPGSVSIIDYGSNGDCAAGTGSFMDQQATRLCYEIEDVGAIVNQVERSAKIAGRCSVFAKSDMIHAQQRGANPPQILKGLCEAVVRNFKANVVSGRYHSGRTAFVGGVANNSGIVNAFKMAFDAQGEGFFVPVEPAYYAAIGATILERLVHGETDKVVKIDWPEQKPVHTFPCLPPLTLRMVRPLNAHQFPVAVRPGSSGGSQPTSVYLGIDIGSVSINLVLMDENASVLHEIYVNTRARPIEVVNQCLQEVADKFGDCITVRGVGTTGSGREMIGELIGADTIKDEITAHKIGASHVSDLYLAQPVDTIFEIGGQDSKFIRLNDGVVIDFAMNEACAAGTGSFLEEQAEKLGVSIIDEFSRAAFESTAPIRLGERCTVYMGMDVTSCLRNGADKQDVIAGLAYSVAQNYLNRVVRGRPLGDVVFFQGGTAYNHSVAAALAAIIGKTIIIPPYNGVMGAYGAALLARRKMQASLQRSTFRGFDINKIDYRMREFTCEGCTNHCYIQQFIIDGVKTYWGDKCSEKYRKPTKVDREPIIEDLLACHVEALERDWLNEFRLGKHGEDLQRLVEKVTLSNQRMNRKARFGMLRAINYFHRHPFWHAYLEALGGQVVVSGTTTSHIAAKGIEGTVAEPCFPIQVAHGHFHEVDSMAVDHIVVPSQINDVTDDMQVQSYLCPFGQTLPFLLENSTLATGRQDRVIMPIVHFRMGERFVEKQLWGYFREWTVNRLHHRTAIRLGYAAQEEFHKDVKSTGTRALTRLRSAEASAVVLIGRPYNIYDPGLNINLAAKLRVEYGLNVLPLDYLPAEGVSIAGLNPNMYWHCGRKILQAVLWTSRRADMHLIYLTNFMCGPDSFLKSFVAEGAGKPFLTLQFDAHGNDAGMVTRIEAYLDSKGLL